jgi:uncharacterized damage-inducible protein DinB
MKWTLLLFCSLASPLWSQTNLFAEQLEKWENAQVYTLNVLSLLPDSSLTYRPTAAQMTAEEQILHLLKNMNWLVGSYLEGTETVFDFNSNGNNHTQLTSLAKTIFQNANQALKELPMEKWDEKVDFFAGPKTRGQIIQLVDDHHTHHRAQLIVYLRILGIKPPRYVGW